MPQPFSPSLAEPVQASQLLPHSPGWPAGHLDAQRKSLPPAQQLSAPRALPFDI